jgi:hypothetical protein
MTNEERGPARTANSGMSSADDQGAVLIDLSVAIVSLINAQPCCRLIEGHGHDLPRLPFGPFYPAQHRTMEIGLRQWVSEQVGVDLGHVEQLYTFGDRGRNAGTILRDHVVSVGYLALTQTEKTTSKGGRWASLYEFFPWEDGRDGRSDIIETILRPALQRWLDSNPSKAHADRINIAFPVDPRNWDEDLVLERYELLYEAAIIPEAKSDERVAELNIDASETALIGQPLQLDHRRILATAMGRLRSKMKYRPVIFDLMPKLFTLGHLQMTAEAILGTPLHKQNFRRLVERSALLESTGQRAHARGRPAELFRFKYDAARERPLAGLRIGAGRNRQRFG